MQKLCKFWKVPQIHATANNTARQELCTWRKLANFPDMDKDTNTDKDTPLDVCTDSRPDIENF